jgi:hypothetical protein
MDSRVADIIARQAALESERYNFQSLWQDVAELILPGEGNFITQSSPGEQRTERVMDSTGMLALRKYAALVESLLMPAGKTYHRIKASDPNLGEDDEVKAYFDQVTRLLFQQRYATNSGFGTQIGMTCLGFGAFGNGSLFIDEDATGLRYRTMPLSETFFTENAQGLVDGVLRKFKLTARQIVLFYGNLAGATVPQQAEEAMRKGRPDQPFTLVHCVKPAGEYREKWVAARGFQYVAHTVCVESKTLIRESGYRTFPYAVMRDIGVAGELYGRSPAMWSLPTLKMLNEMKRTILRGAQKIVDPPLLAPDGDGILGAFDLRPGAMNYGAVNPQGVPVVQPLQTGARTDIGVDLLQMEQQLVNESFYITLFQILAENPRMTATEVMERAAEKSQLLAPSIGRLQSEFLGGLVARELDVLAARMELPPMPPQLAEAGGAYELEMESPLSRAQRAEDGVAIVRTLEVAMQGAQIDPSILDNYDLDEMFKGLAEINGVPAKMLRSRDARDQMREQRAQQQALVQAAELAPGVAKAAKDMQAA